MKISLGIEIGSTRIKSTLIDDKFNIIAQGSFQWESKLVNGNWTYKMSELKEGVRASYKDLLKNYKKQYKKQLTHIDSIGISAMMHGYLAFDARNNLLVPFRTWRNTTTAKAAKELSQLFNFNIPQRYSIAHLYQAILNKENHVKHIKKLMTLAGLVHYLLTGNFVLGIGDASGMFPIDAKTKQYDKKRLEQFDKLIAKKGYPWKLIDILPKILLAGENAGYLTDAGKEWLGATNLKGKVLVCPPEGDAGTGMVSTNCVRKYTCNVSSGTSAFAMVVTDRRVGVHPEIDMVTTPTGIPAAMVHTNNCSSDINAWTSLFEEVLALYGKKPGRNEFMTRLFNATTKAEKDGNGVTVFNYYSGEDITKLPSGKPILVREPDANFNLANFMRVQIMSSIATLKLGMDILFDEGVEITRVTAHGGMLRVPGITQRILAAALETPVSVLQSAGEGGSYGIAILAMYALDKGKMSLENYLDKKVFKKAKVTTIQPEKECVDGYTRFIKRYVKYLSLEREAIKK